MLHNQHKRIAKVKRQLGFSPTWLGNEPTSTAAVLPPVATTPNPVPTTVSTPPPAPPVQTSQVQQSTNTPTTTASTTAPATTEEPTTSSAVSTTQVVSTTSSISSTTPVTSAAPATTAPQQTTARVNTQSLVRSTTPSVTRNVATLTNSQGGVFYSTIVVGPSETPTETATPTPSNVGTIMGAIAGGLVGVVCLIAFVSWLIRQHNKRKNRNHDDFDRQSYLRNSMMIPDEPARPVIGTQAALALARQNNPHTGPRPPTMIERKATLGPSFGPGQVVSFEPGQVVSAPPTGDGAYPSPMAFAAYTPPAQHHQSELSRRPSGAQLLTRQPTNGGMYDGHYAQTPSPGGYSSEYHGQSPNGYHDGYTYPMHPGIAAERGMVQSVTPYQAQQYAEITRALEGPDFAAPQESFHPISPVASPVGQAVSDDNASAFAPSSTHEKPMPNPFDDHKRVDSIPPSLPPFETLSRTGTPIDPNPQHAHYSFDAKGQGEGNRLSVAGISAPVVQPPALPPAAHTREERTVVVGNGEEHKGKRPVSLVDTDDAYGGM